MPAFVRDPKDFFSGAIFVIVGLAAIVIGSDYRMGTAGNMGAGYFPTVLGGLLALIGAVGVVRSLFKSGEPVGPFAIRSLVLVIAGTLLFGFLVRGAGLAVSIVLLVMISGLASIKFRWKPYLLIAIAMAAFSVLVFVKALGLPMPVFGPWLGF